MLLYYEISYLISLRFLSLHALYTKGHRLITFSICTAFRHTQHAWSHSEFNTTHKLFFVFCVTPFVSKVKCH